MAALRLLSVKRALPSAYTSEAPLAIAECRILECDGKTTRAAHDPNCEPRDLCVSPQHPNPSRVKGGKRAEMRVWLARP